MVWSSHEPQFVSSRFITRTGIRFTSASSSMVRVRIIERRDSDDDVNHYAQCSLEIVGLAVAQEVPGDNDSENEDDGVEDFEI